MTCLDHCISSYGKTWIVVGNCPVNTNYNKYMKRKIDSIRVLFSLHTRTWSSMVLYFDFQFYWNRLLLVTCLFETVRGHYQLDIVINFLAFFHHSGAFGATLLLATRGWGRRSYHAFQTLLAHDPVSIGSMQRWPG